MLGSPAALEMFSKDPITFCLCYDAFRGPKPPVSPSPQLAPGRPPSHLQAPSALSPGRAGVPSLGRDSPQQVSFWWLDHGSSTVLTGTLTRLRIRYEVLEKTEWRGISHQAHDHELLAQDTMRFCERREPGPCSQNAQRLAELVLLSAETARGFGWESSAYRLRDLGATALRADKGKDS